MSQRNDDPHGSNPAAITGSIGDHRRSLHDYMYMPPFVATELEQIGAKYLAAKKGYSRPPASSRTISSPSSGLQQSTRRSSLSMASFWIFTLMPVAQDLANSSSLRTSCHVWMVLRLWLTSRLGNRRVIRQYFLRAEQGQHKPIGRRAIKVRKEYCKAAKDLDSKYNHNPDDEIGPVKSALLSFGPVAGKYEGTVLVLGIGCFGELSAGFNDA